MVGDMMEEIQEPIYEGKLGYRDLLREYYTTSTLHIDDIQRREISINANIRNIYCNTVDELVEKLILQQKAPHGVYASTGYYQDPHDCKDLINYELVFDLDTDKAFENRWDQIEDSRKITLRLIDTVLKDLGFEKEDMVIDYSGNKGFHVTITDPYYRNLDASDRRQLLDYIQGKGVDKKNIIVDGKLRPYGWGRQVGHFINEIILSPVFDKEVLSTYFGKNVVKKISALLENPQKVEDLKAGRFKEFTGLLPATFRYTKELSDYVDRKVTTDRRRILRVPGSIHGKSGLPSIRLDYDELAFTEIIVEKLMTTVGLDDVTILLEEDVTIDFPHKKIISAGEHTLPRYEALCVLSKV